MAHLVDELLRASGDSVGVAFKHSPRFRRDDLVEGRLVHDRLLVLEEADNIIDQLTRLFRWRIIKTPNTFLEQDAPERYNQSQNRQLL